MQTQSFSLLQQMGSSNDKVRAISQKISTCWLVRDLRSSADVFPARPQYVLPERCCEMSAYPCKVPYGSDC